MEPAMSDVNAALSERQPDGLAKTHPQVVDLATYLPHHITVIANKWARGSSRIYLKRFGIGVNEWRVLSTIAIEPGCTANRIWQMTSVDTAIISRAAKALEKAGFISARPDPQDPRRTLLDLTPAGTAKHDAIMQVALARQAKLFSGLAPDEIATLTRMILCIRGNLNAVNAPEFMDDTTTSPS
jgi:DNA-binding MarR family transcriptional regulator